MKTRHKALIPTLFSMVLILMVLGICLGSVSISLSDILQAIFRTPQTMTISRNTAYIIRNLRFPRVIAAVLTGAGLALCGLVFQSVFRNPMADSYILGVSSGASFAVGLGVALGISFAEFTLPVVAFTGSVTTAIILFLISKKSSSTLLLSGIAINFLLSALTTLTIFIAGRQAENILFWTLGSLANTSWTRVLIILAVTTAATIYIATNSTAMDLLLMDDSTAVSSGLNVEHRRIALLAVASVVTATIVCFCGIIGFVGLMSPHFIRLLIGPKHKRLIPASMLMGSVIMLFSDLVSRFIVAPTELPIGIVTSILGAPVFLFLLRRKHHV